MVLFWEFILKFLIICWELLLELIRVKLILFRGGLTWEVVLNVVIG